MLFSVGFFEFLALIFPAWVAVVSVLLLRRRPGRLGRLLIRRCGRVRG